MNSAGPPDDSLPSAAPGLPPEESARAELAAIADAGLLRTLRTVEPLGGHRGRLAGRDIDLFCTNDYLGLADDSRVVEAAREAAARWGWGAGAARLISGGRPPHEELEAELARFKGTEAALVLPSGYQANLAAVVGVAGPDDCLFLDKLNHASLIDGARLSGARVRVYAHNDMAKLAELLADAGRFRRRVIVADAVFSMDGDVARLAEIAELAERFAAVTLIDEAHGTGVFGQGGKGAAEAAGVEGRIDVTVGTLSKALGGIGGFVAGRRIWIDLIVNRGRAFLFGTAPPPAQAAAARAALRIVAGEPERRARLHANARAVRAGLADLCPPAADTPAESPIIPVPMGTPERTTAAAAFLLERGLLVPAIRPPTVPPGTGRLRISVSSAHGDDQIARLLQAFRELHHAFPGLPEPLC